MDAMEPTNPTTGPASTYACAPTAAHGPATPVGHTPVLWIGEPFAPDSRGF